MSKVIKNKKKYNRELVFNIVVAALTLLAHISLVLFFVLSYKYYGLDYRTFLGMLGILVCLLVITDLLFYVGFNYKIQALRIINCVLAVLLLLVGGIGSFYVSKINTTVNKVIDNSGTEQYEIIGGVFSYYKNSESGKEYTDLNSIDGTAKVGVLFDSGVGTGSLASEILKENNIDVTIVQYNTTDDLLSALVGKEEDNVDIAVFPASYRQRLENDENVDYSQYLDNIVDFYSFEEKVKTDENESANKDLITEPFNILLIGFAPENEAMTYGLADSIIVATVNPQTFTVSMTSIARDSFVPISCYGGSREKINAARGTSRACLMETVGDLLDIDIDYYMEVNFMGVVQIVDAIGGIEINSPVEFVGQTASVNRGEMTVWVPAGPYHANGEQALAFARERHHMPAGDFDRQKHQQEVISEIVKNLLEMRDVNKVLDVMEAAGNNISTNLSLSQLTGIFNHIISTKNNSGVPTFGMIDIQNMRVTGYSSWTYNYSMRLPLWIYKLYNGSIQEAKDRINDVMNNYSIDDIQQRTLFKFFVEYPYYRGQLYSEYFDEPQEHEEMPGIYPNLMQLTYQEALAWASENGVSLSVSFIDESSPNYNESQAGYVVDQNPRQGALITEYPVGSITVMGPGTGEVVVKDCNDENSCKVFANSKGITVTYQYEYFSDNSHVDGEFIRTNYVNGDKMSRTDTLVIYVWKKKEAVIIPAISGKASDYQAALTNAGFNCSLVTETNGATEANDGQIISVVDSKGNALTPGVSKAIPGDTITIKYYSFNKQEQVCDINATRRDDGTCACNDGYEGDGTTCTEKKNPPVVTCGDNEELQSDGTCGCKSGFIRQDGACVQQQPEPPDPSVQQTQ